MFSPAFGNTGHIEEERVEKLSQNDIKVMKKKGSKSEQYQRRCAFVVRIEEKKKPYR